MNVKELIKKLEEVKNKNKEVYIYNGEIQDISLFDELSDRVDLNITVEYRSKEWLH